MSRAKPPAELKVMRVRECGPLIAKADTPEAVADYWRSHLPGADWYDPDKEAFVVLLLNTRRRVLGHNLVSLGTLDSSIVCPREVFRPAILAPASALVLAHNHPSGDPQPSQADIRITRELVRAGTLMKIQLVDHVILGLPTKEKPSDYCSLRALGYLSS